MKVEQWSNLEGNPIRGFEVLNKQNKVLAIGCLPSETNPGFIVMHAKRYERDFDLMKAIEKLTGIKPRIHVYKILPGKSIIKYQSIVTV